MLHLSRWRCFPGHWLLFCLRMVAQRILVTWLFSLISNTVIMKNLGPDGAPVNQVVQRWSRKQKALETTNQRRPTALLWSVQDQNAALWCCRRGIYQRGKVLKCKFSAFKLNCRFSLVITSIFPNARDFTTPPCLVSSYYCVRLSPSKVLFNTGLGITRCIIITWHAEM